MPLSGYTGVLNRFDRVSTSLVTRLTLIDLCIMRTAIIFLTSTLLCADASHAEEASEFYDPIVRKIEGWQVSVDPALLEPDHRETGEAALQALGNHLQRVKYILPKDRVEQLQKLPIWIDWEHRLGNMQYHPGRGWLLANGHDPRLVGHVHIPRARQLLDPGQWAKHTYAVMHELAHAYHDQVLGFDHPQIVELYRRAEEAGIYKKVLLYTGRQVKHYGLTNHKEYFAESTEAYLGVNDFYPFVRAELKRHDPGMFDLMENVWGKIR